MAEKLCELKKGSSGGTAEIGNVTQIGATSGSYTLTSDYDLIFIAAISSSSSYSLTYTGQGQCIFNAARQQGYATLAIYENCKSGDIIGGSARTIRVFSASLS